MTNVQKEQVQAAIKAFCKAKDIPQSDLARQTEISGAIISNMATGRWDNIADKMWKKVWNYVSPENLKGLFQTSDFESVITLCNTAIASKKMIGLTGDTGMGKTTPLQAFAKRKNVFYYYVDSTISSRVFLKEMLRMMGVQFEGNLNAILNRMADELNTMEDPLIILDECGKLSDKMMLILHSLRDKTKLNAGIILAGMPDFKNKLIKQAGRGTTGYAEFLRRISIWHELKGLSRDEIMYILDAHQITEKEDQREFKTHTRFGDLMNAIDQFKTVNAE